MKQLGKRIRNKREELGLTAEDLGRKLGVNKSTISKWERAEVEHIKRSYINEMSEIFHCSPEWLMGFDGAPEVKVTYNADGTLKEVATTATNSFADLPCIVTETVEGVPTLVNKTSTTPLYVLPGTQTIFEVVFKQNSGAGTVHTKSIDLSESDWTANYKYTYAIGIASTGAISFTASVEDFSPAADKPLTLE